MQPRLDGLSDRWLKAFCSISERRYMSPVPDRQCLLIMCLALLYYGDRDFREHAELSDLFVQIVEMRVSRAA